MRSCKKIILSLFLIWNQALFSQEEIPSVIDFGNLKGTCGNEYKIDFWHLGQLAFNSAPEIGSFINYLKNTFHINTVVETGTFKGNTTVFFSLLFDTVHTIEVVETIYYNTRKRLEMFPSAYCHLGSSDIILKELLPSLKGEPLLFYLDAHWYDTWPLLDELEIIGQTHKDNCIIIIDDFKVPNRRDIPYDKYGNNECSLDYIRDHLDGIFTEYSIHYLIPYNPKCRAKIAVIPKKWKKPMMDSSSIGIF